MSKGTLRVLNDDVIADSGKARLRVLHAAPGGPEFDISIKGATDKLFADVGFKNEAGDKDLEPLRVTLEFRARGQSTVRRWRRRRRRRIFSSRRLADQPWCRPAPAPGTSHHPD